MTIAFQMTEDQKTHLAGLLASRNYADGYVYAANLAIAFNASLAGSAQVSDIDTNSVVWLLGAGIHADLHDFGSREHRCRQGSLR